MELIYFLLLLYFFRDSRNSLLNTPRSVESPYGVNSSVSASLSYMENSEWGRMVTRDLARIKEVQDQNSSLLAQIWQTLQVQNIKALERPSDVPNFPIERKRDFGNLENWLENEQNFCYMVIQ